MPDPKFLKEHFARFFEAPSRETLRDLLRNHTGESVQCDFKETWPDGGDLAKHVLGFANSGGGAIIAGVAELPDKSLAPKGLPAITDKADLINRLQNYIPNECLRSVSIADFPFSASEYPVLQGKSFQVLLVDADPKYSPYVSVRAGSGIRANAIYIRREAKTEEASYEDLQRLLNKRLATGYDSTRELDLEAELHELKALYERIPRSWTSLKFIGVLAEVEKLAEMFAPLTESRPNPKYPAEDFEAFILRCIDLKKQRILRLLGL